MTRKSMFQSLSILILLSIIFYALFGLSKLWVESVKSKLAMEELQQVYVDQVETYERTEAIQQEELIISPYFYELLELNEQIVGWLTIPNTSVNYPIVQGTDNEFYLSHNIKMETSAAGSIFMDYRNSMSLQNHHTILYGHRMKDGTMFGSLTNFLDEEFFEENAFFQYETLTESYELEVFSVYVTTTDFDYIKTNFVSDEEYRQFLQQIKQKSLYQPMIDISEKDRIFTLSTCDYTFDKEDGRLVIHAKVKEKADANSGEL